MPSITCIIPNAQREVGTRGKPQKGKEDMLSIRSEAQDIIDGKIDPENNPLKHAPHTVRDLVGDWDRPYTRECAHSRGTFGKV